eukprot:SAG11_NODE_33028_length_279_cov_1.138889_1_plen_52_part_10
MKTSRTSGNSIAASTLSVCPQSSQIRGVQMAARIAFQAAIYPTPVKCQPLPK